MFNLVSYASAGLQRMRTYRRKALARRQIENLPEEIQRDIGWPRDMNDPADR